MRRQLASLPLDGRYISSSPEYARGAVSESGPNYLELDPRRRMVRQSLRLSAVLRRMLLCLSLLCLLMAPDSLPPERPPEYAALQTVEDHGGKLPDEAAMVRLAQTDPIAFLEWCIIRYDREVTGYRTNFRKQERIEGKLRPSEEIMVDFTEKPFSVLFHYAKPDEAKRVLYIKPDNEKDRGKLVVQTAGAASAFLSIVTLDPDGAKARQSSRYVMPEFGIKIGSQRTLAPWVAAKKDGSLHIEFLGEKKIKELGDRPCWVLKRTRYRNSEEEGIGELTVYIDKETWLQTGSVLKSKTGEFMAEYFFRDVELNPKFDEDTFTRKSLQKK